MSQDHWNVDQYEKFRRERFGPSFDLMDMLTPVEAPTIVDLGCGTGELTAELHQRFLGATTLGIDSSDAMLAKAASFVQSGLTFEKGDIVDFNVQDEFDIIFSTAALHWLPHHDQLFENLARGLKPKGQIAIQVPYNFDHPAVRTAYRLATEPLFNPDLKEGISQNLLPPEQYTLLLYSLGLENITVRLNVYLHLLEDRDAVVEWVSGTTLNEIKDQLPEEAWPDFMSQYRERIAATLPDLRPFPFSFKRILMHASKI